MNELEKLLKDRLRKELEDVIEYNQLYKLLDCNDDREVINHIANDEYHHACKVQCMIDSFGFNTEIELQELWTRAEDCYEE